MRTIHRISALLIALFLDLRASIATAVDAPVAGPYETVVEQYMSGKWDDLEETLKTRAKELGALKGQEKVDVLYIRQNLVESRPVWWKQVKAGKKTSFGAMIFGRGMDVTYDPASKGGVQMQMSGSRMEFTVTWPAVEMDNPAQAEHGYTKGELNNLAVFASLGMSSGWTTIPQSTLMDLTDEKKALLFRVLDFRGNLAGVYYGSPRARQWGLWLYMHSYLDKYAKMQTINARKAVAAAFLMELLANPKKYPSIKLPAELEAENAEEKLALAVSGNVEKRGWTLAEDRSIREAMKLLAAANEGAMKNAGKIALPAGQALSLDPDQDAPLRALRDAWFKKQFDAVKGGGK